MNKQQDKIVGELFGMRVIADNNVSDNTIEVHDELDGYVMKIDLEGSDSNSSITLSNPSEEEKFLRREDERIRRSLEKDL